MAIRLSSNLLRLVHKAAMSPFRLRHLTPVITFITFIAILFLYTQFEESAAPVEHGLPVTQLLDFPDLAHANSTLGFGAIRAVSRQNSTRRNTLLHAAYITELDIGVLPQPEWDDHDIKALRAENNSYLSKGAALAWMGHLNVLRWFLQSDLESILVLEDDVDWDIHLRRQQIPMVAATMRLLVSRDSPYADHIAHHYTEETFDLPNYGYWGNTSAWDVLYLGHCGDIFKPAQWTSAIPRAAFADDTMPEPALLHPYTRKFLQSIEIPNSVRVVHGSVFPQCTYGYAVSRTGATRLLHELAAREREGGTPSYDLRVLEACRDEGLRCWSVNPELFHHMGGGADSEIDEVNKSKAQKDKEAKARLKAANTWTSDQQAMEETKGKMRKQVPNINCGARGHTFYTMDEKTLEYLRDSVGRQGKCLTGATPGSTVEDEDWP